MEVNYIQFRFKKLPFRGDAEIGGEVLNFYFYGNKRDDSVSLWIKDESGNVILSGPLRYWSKFNFPLTGTILDSFAIVPVDVRDILNGEMHRSDILASEFDSDVVLIYDSIV